VATIGEALAEAARQLAGAGVEEAAREAAWLLAHAMGTSAGRLRLTPGEPVPPSQLAEFTEFVRRRAAREPIQYILGTEEFLGLSFRVTPAVLIPRLDTEVLVRLAADRLQSHPGPRVADIGTGSGAIAVGLASLLPRAAVVATDLSPEALAVARMNAAGNHVADRVTFRQGDLLEPLQGERFAAILSNPPYIDEAEWERLMPEVRTWEPKGALTPGPDGLALYRRLAAGAQAYLEPGGFLAVEVGYQQAAAVRDLFADAGHIAETHLDTAGVRRVVVGERAR
jgi:release factor glutamine methyltransferase